MHTDNRKKYILILEKVPTNRLDNVATTPYAN